MRKVNSEKEFSDWLLEAGDGGSGANVSLSQSCCSNTQDSVRFEVYTAVTVKNTVLWDVAPCRSCVNRRFVGTYRFHLQGRKFRERETSVPAFN
jgi:hypothetical protein